MSVILPAILPVFLMAALGFALAKTGRAMDGGTTAFLVATIGTPALVFSDLATATFDPQRLMMLATATAIAIAFYLAVGAVVLTVAGLRLRTYLPSLAFPNSGNLGLPLALYAAGQQGLNDAVIIFSVTSIANMTAGQVIAAGKGKWGRALRSPIIPAVILGVACAYAGVTLPVWLTNTLSMLSNLTIPLMLLMLGTSLARIKVRGFPRAAALSCLRIGMGTAAGFVLASVFGFTGAARVAFVLQCAMPVAVYNYLFAQMYNNDPEDVASLVIVSTVLSAVTTPILLAVLVP
ncbi:MAG TPA: AEC family transporter [Micropepsaceae bacterium]|nr:AEC family transporter [Micropepsaceae bacterium]